MKLGIIGNEFYVNDDVVFGTNSNYMRFVSEFGEPEIIYPNSTLKYLKSLDGIVLPGGSDVATDRYREHPSYWTGKPSQFLENFDREFLPDLIGNVPLIGICRGLQTLNVALGGTLHQHLKNHPTSWSLSDLTHDVELDGKMKIKVNSFHHQGINVLADGLFPLARYSNSLIEAFISSELRIFAVQWHPERMVNDWFSTNNIRKILGLQ